MLSVGLLGAATDGYAMRFGPKQRAFIARFDDSYPDFRYLTDNNILERWRAECDFYDHRQYRRQKSELSLVMTPREAIAPECTEKAPGRKTVSLWGDSHASQLYPGLNDNLPRDWQILQVTSSGCFPSIAAADSADNYCQRSNFFAVERIRKTRPDVVVVAQSFLHDASAMKEIARTLRGDGVGKVLFMGPAPHWTYDLPAIVAFRLMLDPPKKTQFGLDPEFLAADKKLKRAVADMPGAVYVSLTDFLCDDAGCAVYLGDDVQAGLTSWDSGHLTIVASEAVAKALLVPKITAE